MGSSSSSCPSHRHLHILLHAVLAWIVFRAVLSRLSSSTFLSPSSPPSSLVEPYASSSSVAPSRKLMTVDADGNLLLLPLATLKQVVDADRDAAIASAVAQVKTYADNKHACAKKYANGGEAVSGEDCDEDFSGTPSVYGQVGTLQTSVGTNASTLATLDSHTRGLVTLYEGANKTGRQIALPRGDWNLFRMGWGRAVSHITVGPGVKVRAYAADTYSGGYRDLSSGEEHNLHATRFNQGEQDHHMNNNVHAVRIRYTDESF